MTDSTPEPVISETPAEATAPVSTPAVSENVEPAQQDPNDVPEGVATFAATTDHDLTPKVADHPSNVTPTPDASPAPQSAEATVSAASIADIPTQAETVLSDTQTVVDDSSTLIREIHQMVSEIHAAVETVRPLVVDALGNLGNNPLLKMFGGK